MSAENAALQRELKRLGERFADHEKRIGKLESDRSEPDPKERGNG